MTSCEDDDKNLLVLVLCSVAGILSLFEELSFVSVDVLDGKWITLMSSSADGSGTTMFGLLELEEGVLDRLFSSSTHRANAEGVVIPALLSIRMIGLGKGGNGGILGVVEI
jgi:hypothetical protein